MADFWRISQINNAPAEALIMCEFINKLQFHALVQPMHAFAALLFFLALPAIHDVSHNLIITERLALVRMHECALLCVPSAHLLVLLHLYRASRATVIMKNGDETKRGNAKAANDRVFAVRCVALSFAFANTQFRRILLVNSWSRLNKVNDKLLALRAMC